MASEFLIPVATRIETAKAIVEAQKVGREYDVTKNIMKDIAVIRAKQQIGDKRFIEIETLGEHLEQEEVFGTVEAVKTVTDLFMPVSGNITRINDKLEEKPDLVNKDPYGEGWMIKLELDDVNQLNSLLDAETYKKMIEV